MLSSRLNAFVMPTSQTSRIAVATTWFDTRWTCFSLVASTIAAAPNWAPSFASGGKVNRSSARPAAKSSAQPPTTPQSSAELRTACTETASATPPSSPAKIPTPPSDGVTVVCQRSPVGAATTRRASRERSVTQITAAAAGKAAAAASTFTRPDGTEALLIPCEEPLPPTRAFRFGRPWRSPPLSRVGAADDGLCRPAPLPRPVREPVSPRPAGEVQGFRARRALDARQSAAPDGDLPGHLLDAVEGAFRATRPLPALPAHRARAVGVLLGGAPVGVPLDARQREPDQEDALPAPARPALRGRGAPRLLRRDARAAAGARLRPAAARARDRVAPAPARGAAPLRGRRAGARGRLAERRLPRRRAHR